MYVRVPSTCSRNFYVRVRSSALLLVLVPVLTRSTKRMRDQVIVRHQQINIEPDVERLMVCNCRYTPGKGGRAAAE